MTEEIIIDGVDVVECDAYKDKHCKDKTSIIFCDTNLCSNYPYCYYKQLKRLEQENKELKKAYDEASNNSEILHENHSLRIANAKLSEDLWQHGISMREWREQSLKYRSALEEIRKYLNTLSSVDSDFPNTETYLRIQDKINEVLG